MPYEFSTPLELLATIFMRTYSSAAMLGFVIVADVAQLIRVVERGCVGPAILDLGR